MGWSIGYDEKWKRDIGHGVPAVCDHPDCNEQIDRGLYYVCGGEPFGGEHGCGLYFCSEHLFIKPLRSVGEEAGARKACDKGFVQLCQQCATSKAPFTAKPDTQEWRDHKRTDESWAQWCEENPEEAAKL